MFLSFYTLVFQIIKIEFYSQVEQKSISVYNNPAYYYYAAFRYNLYINSRTVILLIYIYFSCKTYQKFETKLKFFINLTAIGIFYQIVPVITLLILNISTDYNRYFFTFFTRAFLQELVVFISNLVVYLLLLIAFTPTEKYTKENNK